MESGLLRIGVELIVEVFRYETEEIRNLNVVSNLLQHLGIFLSCGHLLEL